MASMRGNYAGIGYTYMSNVATLGVGSTDIFISQQPYASWTVGVTAATWYPPSNPGWCSTWSQLLKKQMQVSFTSGTKVIINQIQQRHGF